MHSGSANPGYRLCHKCCMQAPHKCKGFYGKFEGNNLVSNRKGIAVLEIDLMLGIGHFVMRCFYLKSHLGKGNDYLPSEILCCIAWRQVKIPSMINKFGGGTTVFVPLEDKEFQFRTAVKGISHPGCFFQVTPQDIPWVALKRLVAIRVNITDEPCNPFISRSPWKYLVGIPVWF
ncbi:MAG: hypothetical protein BWY05_01556 [Euryarchaeota archaeon ADurb.Bin165]|nr:MAG: hypothetical protein BWY05_01556 [Euryarchaeota archaeon ADurb.Bin165]